jgi:hypothetical protein
MARDPRFQSVPLERPASMPAAERTSMHARALDDLGFIRATMDRAAAYTAIPGWGGVRMGLTALVAAPIALRAPSREQWFTTWLIAAALGLSIGFYEMLRKARVERVSLFTGAGSRFAKALAPGLIAGALLTLVVYFTHQTALLPGLWLLLYGVAVISAGAYSIREVRSMGLAFMLVGAVALLGITWSHEARAFGDLCMAAGFGALHVIYGVTIARSRHG